MRKILLFLLLFSSSPLLAQTAKVLIYAPGDLNAAKATDTTLQKFYHEKIDISDTLTDAINNYEAVFLLIPNFKLNLQNQNLLLNYLRLNRRLYIENYIQSLYGADSNLLWKYIGIEYYGATSMFYGVQYVNGINGTFTEGLLAKNSKYDRSNPVLPAGFYLKGAIIPILNTFDQYNPSGIILAHMYQTDSFKVILHLPEIPDHYNAFLGRVICNYFGLCTPLKVEPQNQIPELSFSVYPNPAHDKFSVLYDAPHSSLNSLELFSSTGSLVSKYSLESNQVDIDLGAKHLSSGTYFLRMLTEKGSVMRPVYLLSN